MSPVSRWRTTTTLYGFGGTRSLRALWGLKELDVDFEFVPVNLFDVWPASYVECFARNSRMVRAVWAGY